MDYPSSFAAKVIITLTDHTRLTDTDNEEDIKNLCESATCCLPYPASICIYPQFVQYACNLIKNMDSKKKDCMKDGKILIACVINFPNGDNSKENVLNETKKALNDGADEIDLVINYKKIINNLKEGLEEAKELTKCVKELIKEKKLKVIIEVGELKDTQIIIETTKAVLEGNADFVKTSTGKVKVNATPENVNAIVEGIKQYLEKYPQKKNKIGIKVAGGVKNINDACQYILIASKILNEKAYDPNYFRLGSSSLVPLMRPIVSNEHNCK